MKKILLTIGFLICFCVPAFGTTYYMRADGTAASAVTATGPGSTQSACMNAAIFNATSFLDGTIIKVCDDGATDYTTTITPKSSGEAGDEIILEAETGDTPIFNISSGAVALNLSGKSHWIFKKLSFANNNNVDGMLIYQVGNCVNIVFEDCSFDHNKANPSYSQIYPVMASGVNDVTFERCSFTNSSDYSCVVLPSSTTVANEYIFKACLFSKTDRLINQQSGKLANWEFTNCTFIDNEDHIFYFANSGSTFKFANCIFEDDSTNRVPVYFSQTVADNIIGTPTNLDMHHNVFWYSDDYLDNMHQFVYGGFHAELIPLVSTNYAIDPKLTAGNIVGSGSYVANRGDKTELPSTDLSGNSWTDADIGCYKNPTKTQLILTGSKAAFVGDSVMLGTGASDEAHKAYSQFDDLTSGLTVVGGANYALGGMYVDEMRFFVDHIVTTYTPSIIFTDIGTANVHYTKPANATNAEIAAGIVSVLKRIEDWGVIPVWLGLSSLLGDPPDNTDIKAINTLVEASCKVNGWRYGNWLAKMEENTSWEIDYYTDLSSDLHPDDDGHSVIAEEARDAFYKMFGAGLGF